METKITLGAVGLPSPVPPKAPTEQLQQTLTLPLREENPQPAASVAEAVLEVTQEEEQVEKLPEKRAGTSSTIALRNLPKPQLTKRTSFDLTQGMKTNIPQLPGLPTPPLMLEATQQHLEVDHSKEEALTKLATKTIIDVQRLEVEFEKFKTEHHEVAMKLQKTIDYLNAVYLQVQMLNAQNMYMAWHGRLVEYNLAGLAGVQMERDYFEQARNEVSHWQQETARKQSEAELAFGKLSP